MGRVLPTPENPLSLPWNRLTFPRIFIFMAATAYDLNALRRLTVAERIQLVEDLWDSIAEDDPDGAFPVTPELARELDRRLAEHERDPSAAEDWGAVRRRITARLRKTSNKPTKSATARKK
jgi:putative addiction module component (TIGR02574 family)